MSKIDRIEIFCQEIVKGKSQRQAYYKAYPSSKRWKPETIDNKAYMLHKSNEVLARLAELRKQAEKTNQITRDDILSELKSIGFSKITDFAEIRGPLVHIKPTDDIPKDKICAVSSVEQGNFGIKLKLYDKLKAREMLIKMLGYDKSETDEHLEDVSDAESEVFADD